MKNIRIFYLKIFPFLVVKVSIYLNRRVFVMVYIFLSCLIIEPVVGFLKIYMGYMESLMSLIGQNYLFWPTKLLDTSGVCQFCECLHCSQRSLLDSIYQYYSWC